VKLQKFSFFPIFNDSVKYYFLVCSLEFLEQLGYYAIQLFLLTRSIGTNLFFFERGEDFEQEIIVSPGCGIDVYFT
jgi:hypothetical protein